MRRLFIAFILGGVAVMSASAGAASSVSDDAAVAAAPTVAVQRVAVPFRALREEAVMVLVGTALIGLAAAVRRAA